MNRPMAIIVVAFLFTHRNAGGAVILEAPNGFDVITL